MRLMTAFCDGCALPVCAKDGAASAIQAAADSKEDFKIRTPINLSNVRSNSCDVLKQAVFRAR